MRAISIFEGEKLREEKHATVLDQVCPCVHAHTHTLSLAQRGRASERERDRQRDRHTVREKERERERERGRETHTLFLSQREGPQASPPFHPEKGEGWARMYS